MVEAGGLPGDFIGIEADQAGNVAVAVMPVAQPADFDARLAPHQGCAVKDGVAGLQNPGLRADVFHVSGHIQHQLQVVIFGHACAAVKVAVAIDHLAPALHKVFVMGDGGGVDHKIRLFQGFGPVQGAGKFEIRAQILGIAPGKLVHHIQALLINIHKVDRAALQPLCQAHIFNQAQGKNHAPRADNGNLHCGHKTASNGMEQNCIHYQL